MKGKFPPLCRCNPANSQKKSHHSFWIGSKNFPSEYLRDGPHQIVCLSLLSGDVLLPKRSGARGLRTPLIIALVLPVWVTKDGQI